MHCERNMANTENWRKGEISKFQNATKLISFCDKLEKAVPEKYAQVHAKGESTRNGIKVQSLIGIIAMDYSKGTGDKNVIVRFNLAPEIMQYLFLVVSHGVQTFRWDVSKIMGTPDANGYAIAQKFSISRNPVRSDGTANTTPWCISISNGKGIKVQNKVGGSYMKGGSYVQEKAVAVSMSDLDLYIQLKRVDSFITLWENAVTANTLLQDKYNADMARYNSEMANHGYPRY